MDGYTPYGSAKFVYKGSSVYSLQCFEGEHEDEYTLKKDNKVYLFQNGIMKMAWEEDEDGTLIGDFTRFENGRVAFIQAFDNILDQEDFCRIANHVKGERMEIYSHESGKLIYYGEFNENRERDGWGIEYDEESGKMLLEGVWKKNKLVEILRKIEGTTMIEFKENGDNIIASNRIPMYIGGFVYDESKELFLRNGRGYWIDEETRIATREVEWKDGVEVSGRDLYDGWYTQSTKPIQIPKPKPKPKIKPILIPKPEPVQTTKSIHIRSSNSVNINTLDIEVTDLVIDSYCHTSVNYLDFSKFERLRSIEIKDYCFSSVRSFRIDGLSRLKSLKIGANSFTEVFLSDWNSNWQGAIEKGKKTDSSFRISNCEKLVSIEIGEFSFFDHGGSFELVNLPSLSSISIGFVRQESGNFWWATLIIKGIICEYNILV